MVKAHPQTRVRFVETEVSSSEFLKYKGAVVLPFFMLKIMGKQQLKAREIKENFSLADLLTRLGYKPIKRVRNELLYISMLRDSDTKPSFSVNDKQGTWFDFGEGKGGNIIDFALIYWPGLSFKEVLEKIVGSCGNAIPHSPSANNYRRQLLAEKEPNYKILDIKDLGSNATICSYLESRGVRNVAGGRLKEIYYYAEDDDKNRSNFFATGWQNETGAWEIRNAHFKGCLGHKAISFIPRNDKSLTVFEGFFDYLSWLTDNPFADESALVLNSLALLQAGIKKAEDFSNVSIYFDNDAAGRKASLAFKTALPHAFDRSPIYEGYNDYNDKIVAELNHYGLQR